MRKFLQELWVLLQDAPRLGAETDEPEGTRYIQLSETLVNQLIRKIILLLENL